ncbi:MAG: phosphotransferase, partial [Pseudomonadota bacterium]
CPYEKIILTSEGLQIINFRKHAPKKTLVAQDLVFFNQVMQDHQIAYLHQMHSIDISILLRQNYLVAIANLLKKLHGSDANFITQTNVFLRNKKLYANFANALADIYDEYLQEQITREQFADIEFFLQCNDKSLKIHEQLALKPQPCHMDPSHKNFLIDSQDKVYLSDWEFASMGDPMFDLANFATSSYLDADQEQHFLQTYFGANYKRNPAYYRYLVQKPTVVLWKLLWYLEQVYLDNKYIADAELKYRIAIRIQEANTFYLSEAFNYALEQLKKN